MSRLRAVARVMMFRRASEPIGVIPARFFLEYLPADPIIVEAGAHIGSDTVELARLWPRGTIHAFEPVPELYTQLVRRTSALANVRHHELALSDSTEDAVMYVSGGASDGSSSLLRPSGHLTDHPDVTFDRWITVRSTTLDSWAEHEGVDRIDFLWLDLQGNEARVLQASPLALRHARVIYTEVSLHPSYEGGAVYAEMREFLEKSGFVVVREELPWSDGGNVAFVRRN